MEIIKIGNCDIDISGRTCNVDIYRNKLGNIEVIPTEENIFESGGYLHEGTTTEGFGDEIIIGKFNRVKS